MNQSSHWLATSLAVSVAVTIVLALGASFAAHDSRWLGRGGSLIAALAAGAVFFQIKREITIESERRAIEVQAESESSDGVPGMPVDRTAQRLRENQRMRKHQQLVDERMVVAASVALAALIGELIHGFGEVLLNSSFPIWFASSGG